MPILIPQFQANYAMYSTRPALQRVGEVVSRGQWQQGAPGRIGCEWHKWQKVQLYTERLVAAVDKVGDVETRVAIWVARTEAERQ